MRKFLAFVFAIVLLYSFSVIGFAKTVEINDTHFLSQFDIGDKNLVLPVDFDSIPSDRLTDFNSAMMLANNPNYITVYSFANSFCTFMVGFIPKSAFRIYYSESSRAYFARPSGNSSFYRIVFNFDSLSQSFLLSAFYYDPGGVPLLSSYYLNGCYISSGSYSSSYPAISFLNISSLSICDSNNLPGASNHTLTVNYLYSEGVLAAAPVTQTIAAGETYSIQSPEIPGYTPDVPLVAGTMPDNDLVIDVYYSKVFYPLTIQYRYQDGTQAAGDVVQQYPAGFAYDIPSPQIAGHQPDKPTVAGTMPAEAVTEVVTYAVQSYYLTVDYRYEDGTQAAESYREQVPFGVQYSVSSSVIAGYTPSAEAVTGIMPGADKWITVTYRRASGGSSGAGSSGAESGGSSDGSGDTSGPGGSSSGGIPPFSGSDPFQIGQLPSYSHDPFSRPAEWPESEYLAFSPGYLYHVVSMLRENMGTVFGVGIYVFLIVLTVYTALHVIDIFQ